MNRRRALLGFLFALLGGFYLLGASGAAVACATSDCASCTVSSFDCVHHMANDCTPGCAAVVPQLANLSAPMFIRPDIAPVTTTFVDVLRSGPEPPPPRRASRAFQLIK